jgi:hypothetical protein
METVFGSEKTQIAAANVEAAEHQLENKHLESTHVEEKS